MLKLIFLGEKVLEVNNDDWRDYTEYFNIYIDGQEVFTLKTDDYATAELAFADFKTKIQELI